ncbi:Protein DETOXIFICATION 40 [Camellia lanceoleosa]|uniref:Protein DETOXIFICATION 40 n=1 Tax=Camellia lanceoleosa TaxID=1840588 RepID=A0ACC0H6E1_9ERIC|nr:Protein DETOXIFICATION 40 [Camellia lanceoleosa]
MELSSQLETILYDKEVPLFHRLQSAPWIELKLMFKLAALAIFVCMVSFGMSTSTQIFSGHLGDLELAAASLRNNGIQMFAYAIVVLALCNGINYAFMDGEIVARAVSELCPLLAFSLILNGIQPLVWEYGHDSGHTGAIHYFGMGDLSNRLEKRDLEFRSKL